jgi:hypothetical protein
MAFVLEGQADSSRHEVPLQFGHLQKVTSGVLQPRANLINLIKASGAETVFVPWGQHDSSQARSALESVP